MILLVKLPVPLPLRVVSLAVVGGEEVLQQTPRAVTGDPLSLDMFPPLCAALTVMLLTVVVFTEGAPGA